MVIDILSILVERERQRRAKSPSWDPRDDDERCESVWNSVLNRGAFLTDETRDDRSGDFWTWGRRSRWSRRSDDSLFCFRGSDLSVSCRVSGSSWGWRWGSNVAQDNRELRELPRAFFASSRMFVRCPLSFRSSLREQRMEQRVDENQLESAVFS